MSSLYIHIPFCKSKCHYCAFNSHAGLDSLYERYFQALKIEISALKLTDPIKTIFFGGGTPTVLGAEKLIALVNCCRRYTIDSSAEITVEANPETIDFTGLRKLRDGGVNRLSFGVQSFNDSDLLRLGRVHTAEKAVEAVVEAKRAGFDNINLDLMSALPGQTVSTWHHNLESALTLEPQHLSIYQLTPEEDTVFYEQYVSGELGLPGDEESLEMDRITKELCAENGLIQYEISNYAKDDCKCQHNINYWHNNSYYAAGAGAVGYIEGVRQRRVDSPEEYCRCIETGLSVIVEQESLEKETSFRETVVVGLRMFEGVSVERLQT